jgi:beta-xylosidase
VIKTTDEIAYRIVTTTNPILTILFNQIHIKMLLLTILLQTFAYLNPVINSNHPDPGILKLSNNTYIAVSTTGDSPNAFPIMTSNDLISWRTKGYVFP